MRRWSCILHTLMLCVVLTCPAWSRPRPMPTTAAPDDSASTQDFGPAKAANIVIQASGHAFQIRGLVLDKVQAGMIPLNDPNTRGLFEMFQASVSWSGSGAVVALDDARVVLPQNVCDVKAADGSDMHLDVPAMVIDGTPYLPVSALPHVLPGKLQPQGNGHYLFDPMVTGIDLEPQEGGGVRLTIESRVPMEHTSFMLRRPNRYVLNIPNVVLDLERYKQVTARRLQHPELGEIRFDQFSYQPNVLRVVIPLKDDQELRVLPKSTPRKMLVTINKPSVQSHSDEMVTQQISDVRVDRSGNKVRITVAASGPFQYEWHRLKAPDNRFFLDIPKAILHGPRKKIAVGDAWLDEVQIGQYQKEPIPTVRILLSLEKAADTRLLTPAGHPNTLVLEVNHKEVSIDSTGLNGVGVCGTPFVAAVTHTRPSSPHPKPWKNKRQDRRPHPAPVSTPPPVLSSAGNGRVICIDPGHGGSDPGALNHALNICEKDVTFDVAMRLRRILEHRGWHVIMTRTTDRDVTYPGSSATEELSARVRVATAFHASLFVSIHCNSSASTSANGSSTHYYKPSDRALANALHPHVIESLGCPDRGVVRNRFFVLTHNTLPSVLIETAFISNMSEGKKLADPSYRQRLAEGIANGLQVYTARTSPSKTSMISQ